jgi:hypothetical protein
MAQIKDDLVLTKEESKFNRLLNCHKRRKEVQSSSELAQKKKANFNRLLNWHKPKKQVQSSSELA